MSKDWCQDINDMHNYFSFHEDVNKLSPELLKEYLQFRIRFLQEELDELKESNNPDDTVDALIDLCVVAIGTLDLYGVDYYKAWDEVHRANMSKQRGVKSTRPNKFGLPDLIKPEGFKNPAHENNYGLLTKIEY